jgi:hypothetical protein
MALCSRYGWIACAALLWTASCSSPSDKADIGQPENDVEMADRLEALAYYEKIFLPDKGKTFRDISLDLSVSAVRDVEARYDLDLTDESPDYLQYEMDLKVDTVNGVDYVEVKYIFDQQDRLDIVTVNYYIQDSLVVNRLFDHLNTSFIEKYGDYYLDSDGYTVWEDSYTREDEQEVTYDIGIRKFIKLNDPGITIEMMRFGTL